MPATLRGVRLLAVTAERAARVVANADLPAELGSDDEWVRTRTGIRERRLADPDQSVVDLAAAAGAKALATAGISGEDLDLVLLATCSLPSPMPAGAALLSARLGSRAVGIDLNAACAGFCVALALAADSVRAGTTRRALVVGAERMGDLVDWADRGTAVLFGDGAGAVVVEACDPGSDGVGPVVWGSDGDRADVLYVDPADRKLRMQGPAVYRWATTAIGPVAREACARAGIVPTDLAAFVPHQANGRITDIVVKDLGLGPGTLVADDVGTAGNTSSASVPMALAVLVDEGRLAPGAPVLLAGFGAGLTWAAQVVRSPEAGTRREVAA